MELPDLGHERHVCLGLGLKDCHHLVLPELRFFRKAVT